MENAKDSLDVWRQLEKQMLKERASRQCRRCRKTFNPPFWCFYSACDVCFTLFDNQKMNGRKGLLSPYHESFDQWMQENPYIVQP